MPKNGEEKATKKETKEAVVEAVKVGTGPKKSLSKKAFVYGGFFILLLLALAAAITFYFKYQEALRLSAEIESSISSEKEAEELVEKLSKLVELPNGEVPSVATVNDISKVSNEPFFKDAKDGDKIIVYSKAKKAYLYRPSINKVINIGPVNLEEANESSPSASQSARPARVLLLNGTATTGLTYEAEALLNATSLDIEVADRDNAVSQAYTDTVIVDVSGDFASLAADIADALSGSVVGRLPDGESEIEAADIIVILGAEFVE